MEVKLPYCLFLLVAVLNLHSSLGLERGTIIPLYIYPKTSQGGDAWAPLKKSFAQFPIEVWAIVNVYNGPGQTKDSNYVSAIRGLHSRGIHTLGYVSTNYTRRPNQIVQREIGRWKNWYGVNGIFLDEMADTVNKVTYYANLSTYAKDIHSFSFVVGNPGTSVPLPYFSAVDSVVVYESPGLSNSSVESSVCKYDNEVEDKEQVAVLAYNVRRLGEEVVPIRRAKECAGYIFVTNDGGDNPWDSLPPYLNELFKRLAE